MEGVGYYILVYIIAFVGYPIITNVLDKCCCFNESIKKLGKRGEQQILKEIREKKVNDPEMNSPSHDVPVQKTDNKDNYNGEFLKKLMTSRVFYNTYPYDINANPTVAQIMLYDSLFVFLNTNELVSTFTALIGHSFSRYERRMAFITQHGLALLLAVIATAAFKDAYSAIIFNILFVTPLTLFVNTSFYYITACPCTTGDWNCCLRCIFSILEYFGSCFAHFYSLLSIIFLIIAGALSYGADDNNLKCLLKYVTEVFVVSTGLSLLLHILKIHVFVHIVFKFCGFVIFDDIGKWLREYVEFNNLDKEKYYSICKIGCLFTIEIWFPVHKKSSSITPELNLDPVVVGTSVEMSPHHSYQEISNSSDYNNVSHAHRHHHHDEDSDKHHHEQRIEDHHKDKDRHQHDKEHHHEHDKEHHHYEQDKEHRHREHDKEHHHREDDKEHHHHEQDKEHRHHEHDKEHHHHEQDKEHHQSAIDQSYDTLRNMIVSSNDGLNP